jgi:hypothetical protein
MRECYSDPTASNPALPQAERLAYKIYEMHEAGRDYSAELQQLGRLAGRIVSLQQVMGAFGSINADTFARKCLVNWSALPASATEDEMLEMLQQICDAKGTEFQVEYWVECLRVNTGDERISDLIFWPDEYFGTPVGRELSATEILNVALRRQGFSDAV